MNVVGAQTLDCCVKVTKRTYAYLQGDKEISMICEFHMGASSEPNELDLQYNSDTRYLLLMYDYR